MFQRPKDNLYYLSNLQIQIIDLLKYKSRYGYEILKELDYFHLNSATLYPALKNLGELGLIKWYYSSQERGPKKRKNYELTEKGFAFVESIYNFKDLPTHYIEAFINEIEVIKKVALNKKVLVIDSTNFFNIKSLLKTKFVFGHEIPPNIRCIRYFDFLKEDFLDSFDEMLVSFPFFIKIEDSDKRKARLKQFFKKVRNQLRAGMTLFVLDLYGDINAISDIFSYIMFRKVNSLFYSYEEMKQILREAAFTNFDLMKMHKGVIIFNTS